MTDKARPILRPYRKQKWERNQCGVCGKFRPWNHLMLHFVPDTAFSSEGESYRECRKCRRRALRWRKSHPAESKVLHG